MNEYVLQLADTLKRCPVPWQNFINRLIKENNLYPDQRANLNSYRAATEEERSIARRAITKELDTYGARKEGLLLYFEDESYYTAFVLKYGNKKIIDHV